MPILLKEILLITNLREYKVHFAKWNGANQPLDGFTKDRARVVVWNVGVLSRDGVAQPQASWATSV